MSTTTANRSSKASQWFARFKEGAHRTIPYIRLQTKLAFTPNRIEKRSRRIIRRIFDVLVFVIILFFAYFLFGALLNQSDILAPKSLTIAIVTLTQAILLCLSVAQQCKRLHKPEDIRLITTFPLTYFQRYMGEIISLYIRLLFWSLLLFWPLMMSYGAAMASTMAKFPSAGKVFAYLFSTLFASLLMPLFPFAFSLVISVPFMYLVSFLQNKNVAKLIIFVIGFVGLLAVYALVLRFMGDWWIHLKKNVEAMEGIRDFLNGMNKWYNPCYFTSEIAITTDAGHLFACFGILLGISAVFMTIGICITRPLYKKFTSSSSVLETVMPVRKIKLSSHNAYSTIFLKEIKQILRTQTYSFFYLGVAFAMPVMTFMVADIIQMVGKESTGNHIFFGFALLILLILMSLIGSFSANSISREGSQFYITKVTPVSYRKQLLAKALVNFTVSFFAMLLCVIVLAATANNGQDKIMGLSAVDITFLFFITTFFLIGVTFNGINLNLARPKIDMANTSPNESNVLIQLLIALVLAGVVTMLTIIIDGIVGQSSSASHGIMLAVMVVYALINFLIFFFTVNKKYTKIEVK